MEAIHWLTFQEIPKRVLAQMDRKISDQLIRHPVAAFHIMTSWQKPLRQVTHVSQTRMNP